MYFKGEENSINILLKQQFGNNEIFDSSIGQLFENHTKYLFYMPDFNKHVNGKEYQFQLDKLVGARIWKKNGSTKYQKICDLSEYSQKGRIDIDLTNGKCTIIISYLSPINLLQNELYSRILAFKMLVPELHRIEQTVLNVEGKTTGVKKSRKGTTNSLGK